MKRHIALFLLIVLMVGCSQTTIPFVEPSPIPSTSTTVPLTATQTPTMPAILTPSIIGAADKQGVIAFYTRGKNAGGIAVIRADGSGEVSVLSVHPTSDSKPAWSPDGSKIAFESLRDDVANLKLVDIYIMNADGSHLTRLTNNDGVYSEPDWSPDGRQILVSAYKDGEKNADLFLLDVETGQETRLTDDPAVDSDPSWSPDGSQIAFTSNRNEKFNIHILDVKTGETIQLTRDSGDNARPDWSPDGKSILFISNRDNYVEIYLMDVDGGNQTRLTNPPDYKSDPEWSPDGKYFAYTSGQKENGDIYVMGFDGADPVLLYKHDENYDGYAAWSGTAVITDEPMFGPIMCMRDTNGDMKPDAVTNTFPVSDQFAYIMFPYRNIDPSVMLSTYFNYEKSDMDMMNISAKWEYGEDGWYMSGPSGASLSMVGGAQNLKIQIALNGEVVQEIECPVVSSNLQDGAPSAPTSVVTKAPALTPTPRPTSTPVTYLPEGFHDGSKGSVDSANCTAFGWAVDPDDRRRDLQVQVLSDGIPVATSTASLIRPDVGACTGGTCGFNVRLWGLISAGEQHQITVQAYDEETSAWVNLSSTPKLLTCSDYPEGSHDGNTGNVNQAGCIASGWAVDPDDRNADVTVRILSDGTEVAHVVAKAFRSDLNKPDGCISGSCGFWIDLWNLIPHGERHTITVQAFDELTGKWVNLDATPKTLTCGN